MKKFLMIVLVLCIIFMVGSIVFAGGDCDEGTPTPSEETTPTPSEETTPTPSIETITPSEEITPTPSIETITPSEEITPEPSSTSEVTNSPENTPGQETAQASVNPTSTNTGSTLPKTGQGENLLIYFGIGVLAIGLLVLVFYKKYDILFKK